MNYRKFRADHLFTGYQMLGSESVLVTTEDGSIENIIPAGESGGDVELLSGMICPGFVNCHCHLELSHMKGVVPDQTGMVDFLLSVMTKRNFPPVQIQEAIISAETNMLQTGIVAVGDICNTADTIPQKKLGNLYYHNFIETAGFTENGAEQRFQYSKDLFKQFSEHYSLPIASNSIVPHAPYSVSRKLFELVAGFPGNQLLSIHNQESEPENELYQSGKSDFDRLYRALGIDSSSFMPTGKRSLESYLPYFYPNQSLILVHNVTTNEEDFNSIAANKKWTNNLFFCLCPNANLFINNTLPDVRLLMQHDAFMVIGTDSLASNHELNILGELKTLQQHFPNLDTRLLLQWATINGAKALQLDEVIGSFESGKQPGIVLIENTDGLRLTASAFSRRIL